MMTPPSLRDKTHHRNNKLTLLWSLNACFSKISLSTFQYWEFDPFFECFLILFLFCLVSFCSGVLLCKCGHEDCTHKGWKYKKKRKKKVNQIENQKPISKLFFFLGESLGEGRPASVLTPSRAWAYRVTTAKPLLLSVHWDFDFVTNCPLGTYILYRFVLIF